ncbi:MAG: TIM barrel protein [Acidobacteriaceae bacterium]|nr:TIM barrel protein [Acidobacteriaceae bacterium]
MMNFRFTRRAFLGTAPAGFALAGRARAQQATGTQAGSVPPPKKAKVTSSVMLWTLKGTLDEKFAKAARAGMQSVELVSEHLGWSDDDCKRYKDLAQSYNLGIDTLVGNHNWTKRPVTMVNPANRAAFLKDVRESIAWAKKLDIPQIIVLSGNEQSGMERAAQYASLVEGAKQAAHIADQENVELILENLNSKVNHPGYFLTSAREALRVVKEVDNPHFRLLFDIYHEYVQNGDVIPTIAEATPYVATFHVADAPGRHDPGTGEMKWGDIYKAIAKNEYNGYITMEYMPEGDEVDSLTSAVTQMRSDLNAAATREPQTS